MAISLIVHHQQRTCKVLHRKNVPNYIHNVMHFKPAIHIQSSTHLFTVQFVLASKDGCIAASVLDLVSVVDIIDDIWTVY